MSPESPANIKRTLSRWLAHPNWLGIGAIGSVAAAVFTLIVFIWPKGDSIEHGASDSRSADVEKSMEFVSSGKFRLGLHESELLTSNLIPFAVVGQPSLAALFIQTGGITTRLNIANEVVLKGTQCSVSLLGVEPGGKHEFKLSCK